MSEAATNWAVLQRGLKPATKLVLWVLCEHHTTRSGCYPSQDQLATAAEISRASVNTQLRRLEAAGLIRRQQRSEQGSMLRTSSRYILGFEADFPEPSSAVSAPVSGSVSAPGTGQNPCPDLRQSGLGR